MLFRQAVGSGEKRVGVAVRHSAFGAVLAELLREWRYTVDDGGAGLLLIEEGCTPPADDRELLWLTRSAAADGLPLPLAVERLWIALGTRFYSSLRQHVRLPLAYPVTVHARRRAVASRLSSLSEMGGRFTYDRELAVEEELELALQVGGETIALPGRVIYVIDRQELGAEDLEVGMVFDRTDVGGRQRLRRLIVAAYLERIRRRLEPGVFREGLSGFHLPPGAMEDTFLA